LRSLPVNKVAVAGACAVAACALLLAAVVPFPLSAPRASVLAGEATVSPLAMMARAPHDLPIEHYDAH
jgi:hypothetical protein